MDSSILLIGVFAIFIPALMLPGPDFVAVVRSSMTHGTKAGLLTTLGVSVGLCLYASLSLIGLSALLIKYQWLTIAVRVLGGSYLIYLGIRLIRTRSGEIDFSSTFQPSKGRSLLFGFLVTLTNPKAMVLFSSVFATAVTPSTPHWLMVTMIALVTLSSLVWYSCVSVFISSPPVMRRFQDAKHWIERTAGGCFIAIGGKVLTDARNPIGA